MDGDLAARLAPWLETITTCSAWWAPLPTHGYRLGVVVELFIDTNEIEWDEDDASYVTLLRETVDLVQLALAVEPAALDAIQRTARSTSSDGVASPDREDAIQSVLAYGVRTELRLRVGFKIIDTYGWEESFTARFMGSNGANLSTDAAFRTLRRDLLGRLREHEDVLEHVKRVSVPITLQVESDEVNQTKVLDAEDFFVYLTGLSEIFVNAKAQAENSQWRYDEEHVPVAVAAMELVLYRFCITHRVVKAVKRLISTGIAVRVKQLHLDPRLVCCANEDVREFAPVLSTGAKDLKVETGVDSNEHPPYNIDMRGQDRRETINDICEAIASLEHIRELNLGGLFNLFVSPANRLDVWRLLFRGVFSRDVLPEVLMLEDDVTLEPEDRDSIRTESTRWRLLNPTRKLFIRSLRMQLSNTDVEELEELLAAFDDVEELELTHLSGHVPSRVLYRLLSYPKIKRLRISGIDVPSMELFDPSVEDPQLVMKPALEELVLDNSILQDSTSMAPFVEKLQWGFEEPTGIGKTLRRLHLIQSNTGAQTYRWDCANLKALDRALTTNRILREVQIVVNDTEPGISDCESLLLAHNKDHLPVDRSRRKSVVTKARNLAFMSAIRSSGGAVGSARSLLDAVAVRHIIEFAAPHQMRKVEVYHLKP